MNKMFSIFLLIAVNGLTNLTAQDFQIFELRYFENDSVQRPAFISLSEVYPLSDNPDSLAVPDLSNIEIEAAPNYTYIRLDSIYRKRFLSGTNISETDKVYIYDYSIDALLSFKVKNLDVVAHLNTYGADWPYTQDDYMIGFEINKKLPDGFGKYFTNSLAYVGKKNPFARGQVKHVIWKKIESKEFPSIKLASYDTSYAGKCFPGDAYKYETESLQYFVKDLVRITDNWLAVKWLIIIDLKTKETVCEKLLYAGEGATFAPLDNQWTGKLFKNKSPVIFGFHYVSFGCPAITFLNTDESDIYIYCDNRH